MKQRAVGGLSALAFVALMAFFGLGSASAHSATNSPTLGNLRIHASAAVNRVCSSPCVSESGTFAGTFFLNNFTTDKGSMVADMNLVGKITYTDTSVETVGFADRLVRISSITLEPGDKLVLGDLNITFNSAYLLQEVVHNKGIEQLGFYHFNFDEMTIEETDYVNPVPYLGQVFTAPQIDGKVAALNTLLGIGG